MGVASNCWLLTNPAGCAAPPDPILGVAAAFKEDPSADKVNLVRFVWGHLSV